MKSFLTFLLEKATGKFVALTPMQLIKPNSKTGESRIDILIAAIKAGTPINLASTGKTVKIDNTPENIESAAKFKADGKAFDLTAGSKSISSNEIGKSQLFGGGGSAKGGGSAAAVTARGESAQCYYNSLVGNILRKKITIEDVTEENLISAAKYVDADISVKDVIEGLSEVWKESAILIANKLLATGYLKSGQIHHRGSKVMNIIYDGARKALKNSGHSLANDKWNPGDIWIDGTHGSFKNDLDDSSISSYNDGILNLYNERNLIAVSLKLAKGSAKVSQFNVGEILPPYEVAHLLLRGHGAKSAFVSNAMVSIILKNGLVFQGRSFTYMSSFAFEVLGKNARAGKIGISVIQEIAKNVGIRMNNGITKSAKSALSGKKLSDKFIKEWWKMYYDTSTESKSLSLPEFTEFMQEKFQAQDKRNLNWMWSKYIGTYLIYSIKNAGRKKADEFVGAMVNHAKSSTANSSAFIKVA